MGPFSPLSTGSGLASNVLRWLGTIFGGPLLF